MLGQYILNTDGEPVPCDDMLLWGAWLAENDRVCAQHTVNGVFVSTVFLGLNHSFNGAIPLLWETMVFEGSDDSAQWRYASAEAALTQHNKLLHKLRQRTLSKSRRPSDQQAFGLWLRK